MEEESCVLSRRSPKLQHRYISCQILPEIHHILDNFHMTITITEYYNFERRFRTSRVHHLAHFYVDPDSEAAPSASPVFSALAVSPFSSGFVADFSNDCSKSLMISSMCSVPTLILIKSSVTPEFSFSSSLSCSWVVLQG
jgi:hypothetical protein